MTRYKPVELDYLPTREGGEDQLHTHISFRPSAVEKESCGACAQLANDFKWLRFNDAVADVTFEDRAVVMAYAELDVRQKLDAGILRGFRDPELVA